jgi:hypothetical protein
MRTEKSGRGALRACATVVLLASVVFAADSEISRLARRARGNTPLERDLRELCDGIGGRPTGSESCKRAELWAARKLREAGLDNVHLESFTVPNLWLGESAEAAVIAPATFSVRLAAAPFTTSTKGTVEAAVIDAGDGSPEAFAKIGTSARGAILLIHSKEMHTFDDLFAEYMRNNDVIEGVRKTGASAVLLQSTRPRGLLYRHPLTANGSISPFPAAIIAREQAERIGRLASSGPARMRLRLTNRVGGSYESNNVVADIRGSEKPDEIVLFGAHLDSWDLGTGSEDNGANCAMLIDVARGFKELNVKPRRTIRFVLFTGEEQGMWGSAGYVSKHRGDLSNHVAVTIFDTGTGKTTGFYLNGREELKPAIDQAVAAAGGDSTRHSEEALDGTDNFDFLLSGVPNLVGIQDPAPYLPDYHAETDTPEHSNMDEERNTAAIASALAFEFANMPGRPPRQTREQVQELLIRTKVDGQMRGFGQWDDWTARRRGMH